MFLQSKKVILFKKKGINTKKGYNKIINKTEMFSPKIEIINHFDELFNRLNNEIDECLEKYKKNELLDQKISCKFRNRELRSDRKFVIHLCNWLEKNKEETEDLWPKSTKIGDYLKTVRMRTIDELRKEQKERLKTHLNSTI